MQSGERSISKICNVHTTLSRELEVAWVLFKEPKSNISYVILTVNKDGPEEHLHEATV